MRIAKSDREEAGFYEDYGGESQVNIDIFERAEVDVDAPSAVPEVASDRNVSVPRTALSAAKGPENQPGPRRTPRLTADNSFHIHLPETKKRKPTKPTVHRG
jgi:hypothetical protein